VVGLAAGDHRFHPACPQRATVLVVVVAAVGDERLGPQARAPHLAADRTDAVEKRQQLGDVVAVTACHRDGQRDAARVG